jgi:hypothetical protein
MFFWTFWYIIHIFLTSRELFMNFTSSVIFWNLQNGTDFLYWGCLTHRDWPVDLSPRQQATLAGSTGSKTQTDHLSGSGGDHPVAADQRERRTGKKFRGTNGSPGLRWWGYFGRRESSSGAIGGGELGICGEETVFGRDSGYPASIPPTRRTRAARWSSRERRLSVGRPATAALDGGRGYCSQRARGKEGQAREEEGVRGERDGGGRGLLILSRRPRRRCQSRRRIDGRGTATQLLAVPTKKTKDVLQKNPQFWSFSYKVKNSTSVCKIWWFKLVSKIIKLIRGFPVN